MNFNKKIFLSVFGVMAASSSFAAPMPNTIVIEDKAVVPIVKTQVIRTLPGREPVRTVNATIFEVTNKGKDVVARDVVIVDDKAEFSDEKMRTPVVQQGSVIVPTSKIEVDSKVMRDGEVVAEAKQLDASGVEFKKGQEPVQKNLKINQIQNHEHSKSATHAVIQNDGKTTKDVVVIKNE
ncbi:hypothetical protein E0H82_07920 [Acinetobacter sp. ANC 4910]|uniref:hypothetical protein n=1 Tax=Acinetobacter sp. ANC 4910 TaxID=2529850 RepID=UPI001040CFED|nr:hypothetical protein [Acinetobacter sp. ANC 4910]TCB35892.1 hypothetical protein E0H82_07920 [Acinetobacter sp. ANC 4910]